MTPRLSLDHISITSLEEPLLLEDKDQQLSPLEASNQKILTLRERIFNSYTGNIGLSISIIGLGTYETSIYFLPSLFRSADAPNLKPALTSIDIMIIKPLFLSSGLFFMTSGCLLMASTCFNDHKNELKTAFKVMLIVGTLLEIAPFVVALS